MTTEDLDYEMGAVPSGAQSIPPSTPKVGFEYFNKEMCLASSKKQRKSRVELCTTVLPVLEPPLSPPDHEREPSMDTPSFNQLQEVFMLHITCKTQDRTKMLARICILGVWSAANQQIK